MHNPTVTDAHKNAENFPLSRCTRGPIAGQRFGCDSRRLRGSYFFVFLKKQHAKTIIIYYTKEKLIRVCLFILLVIFCIHVQIPCMCVHHVRGIKVYDLAVVVVDEFES